MGHYTYLKENTVLPWRGVEVGLQWCRRDEGNNKLSIYGSFIFFLSFELIMLDCSTTVTVIIGYELIVKSTETYVPG